MSTLTHPLQHISGKDHDRRIRRSRSHRQHWRLCFADDIDCLAGEEEELVKLIEGLGKASTAYGREINAGKTKVMTNNTSGFNKEIKVNG